MHPDLHICVVSFNTRQLLDDCLRSLSTHICASHFVVTVVDNGSTDRSVAMVREKYPQVQVVELNANSGYGRANNFGLLNTPGRYYLVLNSDTLIQDGAIDALVGAMDANSALGAAGGALLNPDGSPQTNWAAGDLTLASVFYEQTYLAKIFPRSKLFGDYFRTGWARDRDAVIPQACGACLIVRSDVFNQLGGFDPAIFMYAEDTDLCRRIRDRGLEVGFIAGARFTHLHGQSSAGELRPRMVVEHNRSRIYYFAKHVGPIAACAGRALMVAGALLRALLRSCTRGGGAQFVNVACWTALAHIPPTAPRVRRHR
jgi:GT2 family glycosyltransferase